MAMLRLYFDGACPLCSREIAFLRKRDERSAIDFVDIAAPSFSAEAEGLDAAELMAEIHARLEDGTLVRGVEAFRRVYEALGFSGLVFVSRFLPIAGALEVGYRLWAKNRLRLTGRCTSESCAVDSGEPTARTHA